MIDVICIMGATATGKSSLAVRLAQEFGGEVIGADSMQIYKGFDIGTGKITPDEMQEIPHHLVDCFHPLFHFSAGAFRDAAAFLVERVASRGNLPIIAGGTGLYIRALLEGLADVGYSDLALRKRLTLRGRAKGSPYMHKVLERLDPVSAGRIAPGDSQRILRALEYRLVTGHTLSSRLRKQSKKKDRYNSLKLYLWMDRAALRKRIDSRIETMFEQGWIGEVDNLLSNGIPYDCGAMRAIGYREIVQYLRKEVSLEEAKSKIRTATHQYAKRQETWFKKEAGVQRLELADKEQVERQSKRLVKEHLRKKWKNG